MNKFALFCAGAAALGAASLLTFRSSAIVYPVSLSASETLALYGSTITGYYYTGSGVDLANFEYVGTTYQVADAWTASASDNSLGFYWQSWTSPAPNIDSDNHELLDKTLFWGTTLYDDQNTPAFISLDRVRTSEFLIYKWDSPATLPAAGSFDFQIQLNPVLNFKCAGFGSAVFWSSNEGSRRDLAAYRSNYTIYDSEQNVLKSVIGIRPSNNDYANYYARGSFPAFLSTAEDTNTGTSIPCLLTNAAPLAMGCAAAVYPTSDNQTDENQDGIPDSDLNEISIGSSRLNIKRATSTPYASNVELPSGTLTDFTSNCVYIYIMCPVIWGDFIPPTPEVDPIESIQIDVENISSDIGDIAIDTEELRQILLRMESVQSDILTVERVHTSQFIDILSRLQSIYEEMLDSGQIPDLSVPDLNPAPDFQIDSAVDSRIVQQFEDADLPDFSETVPPEEAGSFFNMIHNFVLWFPGRTIMFYSVGLILAVVCWALFKGR